jgi:hypothetical protein
MINFIIDILWLSSALAVFSCIVLFILNPLYDYWVENKNTIDKESALYSSVVAAVAQADGENISIQLVIGDDCETP